MYPSFQFMYWTRAANPLYHYDFDWQGCTPPGGFLTRTREWLGIGGIPRPSSDTVKRFRQGYFASMQRKEKMMLMQSEPEG